MRIGIMSDTHGLLRPEVLTVLASCEAILHAGDVDRPEILDALRRLAPLEVVRGNNDKAWAEALPPFRTFSMAGVHFFMVHDRKDLPKDLGAARVVIFGHSHQYFEQWIDGRLWLNPGSCGRRRFRQELTFAMVSVKRRTCSVEKIALDRA